jgi:hypothetical protein
MALEGLEERVVLSPPAIPLTITVNTAQDQEVPDAFVSLREAIDLANGTLPLASLTPQERAQVQVAPGAAVGTIDFDPNVFRPNGLGPIQTITLGGTELPQITSDLTIVGLGVSQVQIDGAGLSRIFDIGATVRISGVSLINGQVFSGNDGGAIIDFGNLTLVDSTLSGNISAGNGGAIDMTPGSNLALINSTLSGNYAYYRGGGIFRGNDDSHGSISVTNSKIAYNQAGNGGGGISIGIGTNLTLTDSTVTGNTTLGSGPLLYSGGGGISNNRGSVSLSSCVLYGNGAASYGGGISNQGPLTITNSILSGNSAEMNGGGIFAFSDSSLVDSGADMLRISNSTITQNFASNNGGGIGAVADPFGPTPSIGVFLFDTILDGNTSPSGIADAWLPNPARENFDSASAYNVIGFVTDDTNLRAVSSNRFQTPATLGLDAALTPGPGSPERDAGSLSGAPATDVYGDPRTTGGQIDIGAVQHGVPIVTWTGSAGDNLWDDPGNWSTGSIPTATDRALISLANPIGITITQTGNDAVASITSNVPIQVQGSLTLVGGTGGSSTTSAVQGLTIAPGGTLTIQGSVVLAAVLGLTNGGTLAIAGGSPLVVEGSYIQQAGGLLQITLDASDEVENDDRLQVTGTLTLLGGSLVVDLAPGFTPGPAVAFLPLTYGSGAGVFSSMVLPAGLTSLSGPTFLLLASPSAAAPAGTSGGATTLPRVDITIAPSISVLNLAGLPIDASVTVASNPGDLTLTGPVGDFIVTLPQDATYADLVVNGGSSTNTFIVNNYSGNVALNPAGVGNTIVVPNLRIADQVVKDGATIPHTAFVLNLNEPDTVQAPESVGVNNDVGTDVDPSLLVSGAVATLKLGGTFQDAVLGSNVTLYAAPATADGGVTEPGTYVVLAGTGNKVFAPPGTVVQAFNGGNNVVQTADAAATAAINAYADTAGPQAQGYLRSVPAGQQAFLLQNVAGVMQYLVASPANLQAFVASDPAAIAQFLSRNGAAQQAYLAANTAGLAQYLARNPAGLQAYLRGNGTAVQAYISGSTDQQQAFLRAAGTGLQAYLAANPAALTAYLAGDSAGVGAYLASQGISLGSQSLQAYLTAHPDTLTAYLSASPTSLQAYLLSNGAALSAYVTQNATAIAQYLARNPAGQQAYLRQNAAGVAAYLQSSPTGRQAFLSADPAGLSAFLVSTTSATTLSAFLMDDAGSLQAYLSGGAGGLQAYLAVNPAALQAFLVAVPSGLQAYLSSSPSDLNAFLTGSPTALQAYLRQNAAGVAAYLAGNPVGRQAYLQADAAGVSAYLVGDAAATAAYLRANPGGVQAYLGGGAAGLQAYIQQNPGTLQQFLEGDPGVLQAYLAADPAALQQYLAAAGSTAVAAAYLAASPAGRQAYLAANAAGLAAYLASDATTLNAYLATDAGAGSAYLGGGVAGLQAYLAASPAGLQAYLAGNPAALQAYLAGNPTGLAQYLASAATALQQYLTANPAALQTYLGGSPAVLQQYLSSSPAALQAYLLQNSTAVAQYLSTNPAARQAFIDQSTPDLSAYIAANPAALAAYLGADAGGIAAYLASQGISLGTTSLQAYLTANPARLQAYLTSNPAALQAYLTGTPGALQAYLQQDATAVAQYIAGNAIAQQAYLASDPGGVAQYITASAAGQQAYLRQNGAGLAAFLAADSAALAAYLGADAGGIAAYLASQGISLGATSLQAYLTANPARLQAYLTSSPAALQAYLTDTPGALDAYLQQDAAEVAQYLADDAVSQQGYLSADAAGFSAYLVGNPTALDAFLVSTAFGGDPQAQVAYALGTAQLQAYLAGNPTSLQAFVAGDPAALQQYLAGNPSGLQAFLTANHAGISAYLSASSAAQQAYLSANIAGLGAYLTSSGTSLSAFLAWDASSNAGNAGAAYLSGGSAGLQAYLVQNVASLQAYVASQGPSSNLLLSYLSSTPTGLAQYLAGAATPLQQYIRGNPTALQTYLTGNPTGLLQYIEANPTALLQYLRSNPPALQTYLSSNAGAGLGQYLSGSSTVLQQYLAGNPAALQQYLTGAATALQAYLQENPAALLQYLEDSPTALAQYLSADPSALESFFENDPSVLQTFLSSDPAALQQFLQDDPALLEQFLTANAAGVQQFLTGSLLGTFRLDVTLQGSGNEATGGVLSTFNIGSDGLFLESIDAGQLSSVSQGVAGGIAASSYALNVTANGSGNTLVGGVLASYTVAGAGGGNTFVIEDGGLLGLPGGTAIPSTLAATFSGNGAGDRFSFVGGASGNSFGAVVLTEPAGTTGDVLDFSGLQGGGITLRLNTTGPQVVSSGANLTLTLPAAGAVTHILGSPASDTIVGDGTGTQSFSGSTAANPDPNALPAVPPASVPVQWVALNFTAFSPTVLSPTETFHNGDGSYTVDEQEAVLQELEKIYSPFSSFLRFTLDPAEIAQLTDVGDLSDASALAPYVDPDFVQGDYQAGDGPFETIYFNDTPVFDTNLGAGGIAAVADAQLGGGSLTNILLRSGGSGYLSAPPVTLVGGGGTGATATATVVGGQVTGIVITNPGTDYFAPPTVVFGTPSAGGFSNEVDFGNLNRRTTMQLDVNGFLGTGSGLVPDSGDGSLDGLSNFVNLSITIAAHELGHTLGLEHMDSLGPIGSGIANPPGASKYYPAYAGPLGAFTTQGDILASPASVGSTLAQAASGGAQLGARDAIALAFIAGGTTVASNATDPDNPSWNGMLQPTVPAAPQATDPVTLAGVGTVSAQPVSLYTLDVPNPLTTGHDAGKSFDVSAVAIDGYVGGTEAVAGTTFTRARPNYYTFRGTAGQVMTFQVMSASITSILDPVDTTLTIYGPDGQVIAYNDDQFEPSDSSILDLTLPASGTYTVEVDSFHTTDPSFNDPDASNYDPAAYYDAKHGAYELFIYAFSAYDAHPDPDNFAAGVSLVQPSFTNRSLPTFTGMASVPQATVSIKIYAGTVAAGQAFETLSATPGSDRSYSVTATIPLPAGATYTAVSTQSDSTGDLGDSLPITFTVAAPTIGIRPISLTYGTALANGQLLGTANWPDKTTFNGTFAFTTAAGSLLNASTTPYQVGVTFTPADTTHESAVSTTVTVTVAQATPTVSVAALSLTYGTALANSQLSGTASWVVDGIAASVSGMFTYAGAAGTVLNASGPAYSVPVTFTPADATNYTTAATSVAVRVARATPTFSGLNAPTVTPGTATTTITGTLNANAGRLIPGGTGGESVWVTFNGATVAAPLSATDTFSVTLDTSALGPFSASYPVSLSYPGDGNFAAATGSTTVTLNAPGLTPGSVYVLNPTAAGALTISGSARLNLAGPLVVDSRSASAIQASGTAVVTAASVLVAGGVSKSSSASVTRTGVPTSTSNPLASLPEPAVPGYSGPPVAVKVGGSTVAAIAPGLYSQITLSNNARLTLSPGVYVIAGGGVTLSNSAVLNAPGVTFILEGGGFSQSGTAVLNGVGLTIFNAGSNYKGPGTAGGSYGPITLTGIGSFSPPASGPYAGILIFQPGDNTQTLTFSGNANLNFKGTILAPGAPLVLSNSAQLGSSSNPVSLVVDRLTLSGTAIANGLTPAAPAGATAYDPAQIRLAYGINGPSQDGTGQAIAIVDAYHNPAIERALDTFDRQFGTTSTGPSLYQQYGPASSFLTVLNQSGQPTSPPPADPSGAGPGTDNWEVEEALDVEWAHAIAPGARIILVEANSDSLSDLMAAVRTAAAQPGVSVVSMSWGFAEGRDVFSGDEAALDPSFQVPGVTFVASTGDHGADDREYPASSPYVLSVGGTSLRLNADGSYGSETGWGGAGGGLSLYEPQPAYQAAVQSSGRRTTPDVALVADPATGVWVADPYNLGASNPFRIVGGTSLSAPAWAALLALANQGRVAAGRAPLNGASPTEAQRALYGLPQDDYHAIAGAGYNVVTGLGTPVADRLVSDLAASGAPGVTYPGPKVAPLAEAAGTVPGATTAGPIRLRVEDLLGAPLTPTLSPSGRVRPALTTAPASPLGDSAGPPVLPPVEKAPEGPMRGRAAGGNPWSPVPTRWWSATNLQRADLTRPSSDSRGLEETSIAHDRAPVRGLIAVADDPHWTRCMDTIETSPGPQRLPSTLWDDALQDWVGGCEAPAGSAAVARASKPADPVEARSTPALESMAAAASALAAWSSWEIRSRRGDRRNRRPLVRRAEGGGE